MRNGLLILSAILGLTGAAAADECHKVHATLTFGFVSAGCTSLVGLCTAGQTTHGGILNGTTTYTVDGMAFTDAANASYHGVFVITTKHGTLILQDTGTANFATGAYTETDVVVSGTGRFANATGNLTIIGNMAPGATSTIVGQICKAESDHEDENQSE